MREYKWRVFSFEFSSSNGRNYTTCQIHHKMLVFVIVFPFLFDTIICFDENSGILYYMKLLKISLACGIYLV